MACWMQHLLFTRMFYFQNPPLLLHHSYCSCSKYCPFSLLQNVREQNIQSSNVRLHNQEIC